MPAHFRVYDRPPTAVIEAPASTRTQQVNIRISGTEVPGSGQGDPVVTHMRPSGDLVFPEPGRWVPWEESIGMSWVLTPGTGEKTIYVELRNSSGVIGDPAEATIVLAADDPTLAVLSDARRDAGPTHVGDQATIRWVAGVDVDQYEVRVGVGISSPEREDIPLVMTGPGVAAGMITTTYLSVAEILEAAYSGIRTESGKALPRSSGTYTCYVFARRPDGTWITER